MKLKKEELKEMKKLLRSFGFCSGVEMVIDIYGVDTWDKCTSNQLLEFLGEFTQQEWAWANRPVMREIGDYYKRAFVAIELALVEIFVELAGLQTKEWYELVDAAMRFADSGATKDAILLRSKADKFKKYINLIYLDSPYQLLNMLHCTPEVYAEDVSEEALNIERIVSVFKMRGSPKERAAKSEKFVADRIRKMVDPPSIKELRALIAEKERIDGSYE